VTNIRIEYSDRNTMSEIRKSITDAVERAGVVAVIRI
jgi:hypothetical protein